MKKSVSPLHITLILSVFLVQNLNAQKTPVVYANCSDLGAENGWAGWKAATGLYSGGAITFNATNIAPTAPRFNLTSGSGIDGCSPGPAAGAPPLQLVAPGFGNASIQLGTPRANGYDDGCSPPYPTMLGGCVEQLTYSLTVTPQDTNFVYAYAIVLENPINVPHSAHDVPFAEIYMLDQNGDTIQCSHHKYTGSVNATGVIPPGMFAAACPGPVVANYGPNGMDVAYKPWSVNGLSLANYIGQTITIVLTNVDCGKSGHFCHSYWDFKCGTSVVSAGCTSQSFCAPQPGPGNQYTYQWYQNGQPYAGSNATAQCITPIVQAGDTFAVKIQQTSGCGFWMTYVPQPLNITPDFISTTSGSCSNGTAGFTNTTTVSNNATVSGWNWSFPGGTPASSTQQNPGNISYPPGTYTVILTATTPQGCSDTVVHTVTIPGINPPTAAFTSTPPCLGGITQLSDGSVSNPADPIVSWNWQMNGGTPSSAGSQNTSTLYGTAGTHTVVLVITTQQGCKDTITQQVLVYNPPVANFSGPAKGCAPVCNAYADLSTSTDGSIVNWQWDFPGGSPSSSSAQNPQTVCYYTPGTYGASLIITNSYGCKDTISFPAVEVYPWPKADFCVAPSIAPATDPVFSFCDQWSNDVVQWTWNFGDNDTDIINTDPIHSYAASANTNDFYSYNICLRVVNQYGCWDTICKPVELVPEFTFYIPNTFTPNGDWLNEMFFGKSRGVKEYNIWLFDRWGNQIWDCHHEGKNTDWDSPEKDGLSSFCQWDGIVVNGGLDMNGNSRQLAQEDVYVWKVKLTDIFDKQHNYLGHVSIVR